MMWTRLMAILALQAADELWDGLLVGDLADEAKQGRFFVGLLGVRRLQQVAHAEALLLGAMMISSTADFETPGVASASIRRCGG